MLTLLLWVVLTSLAPAWAIMNVQDYIDLPNEPATSRSFYGFGDLFLPEQTSQQHFPVAVLIHGGCWLSDFNLRPLSQLAKAITKEGIAVWSIEYRRLYGGGGWPVTFTDVGLAVDHLQRIATDFPLNITRVVVAGHSSGGHLALWTAARNKLEKGTELYQPNPLHITGVVSIAGIPDLQQATAIGICGNLANTLMGGSEATVPNRYAQGSPKKLAPLSVPQIFVSGVQDPIVPYQYVSNYVIYGRKKGDHITLRGFNDTGHFEPVSTSTTAGRAVVEAIVELIRS